MLPVASNSPSRPGARIRELRRRGGGARGPWLHADLAALTGRRASQVPILAQVNIARQRAPLDAPLMGEFVAALDRVNRIAEHSPGFVWRLRSPEGHGVTTVSDGLYPIVVNLSVWDSYEALHGFVYRSPHGAYQRRRSRWFEPTPQPSTALWWVETQASDGRRGPGTTALSSRARTVALGLQHPPAIRAGRSTSAPTQRPPVRPLTSGHRTTVRPPSQGRFRLRAGLEAYSRPWPLPCRPIAIAARILWWTAPPTATTAASEHGRQSAWSESPSGWKSCSSSLSR